MKYDKGVYAIKNRKGNKILLNGKKLFVELKDDGIYLRSHEVTTKELLA